MYLEKEVSVAGEFAKKGVDIKHNDTITILDEGQKIKSKYKDKNGNDKYQTVFRIGTANGEKLLAFNRDSLNHLIDVFGNDTSRWINAQLKVILVRAVVSGKITNYTYLVAPGWEFSDGDMRYVKVIQQETPQLPVTEEIKVEDIPF